MNELYYFIVIFMIEMMRVKNKWQHKILISAALYCDKITTSAALANDFFIYFLIHPTMTADIIPLEVSFRRHLHWTTTLNCQFMACNAVQSLCLSSSWEKVQQQ